MKQAVNTCISAIMLMLILLGAAGVSVEKCSCTGRISMVLAKADSCCPAKSSCMTVKSMHLSNYLPSPSVTLDMPQLPLLTFSVPPAVPAPSAIRLVAADCHRSQAPPGSLATTVAVLRV